jgi:hypothetical protein
VHASHANPNPNAGARRRLRHSRNADNPSI